MLNSINKVDDLHEFKPFLLNQKRIMGLDLGKKRIGVSISTHSLDGALPLRTISEDKLGNIIDILKSMISEYNIIGIIFGLPKNMEFDKDSLYKLGKLSKIQIDESKLKSLSSDLGSIIEFIDRLKSIDTKNVDPTSNSLDQSLVMRDDIASDVNSANEILENAPQKELDFFSVPKVIE